MEKIIKALLAKAGLKLSDILTHAELAAVQDREALKEQLES